jgi:dethiobiotin synthetase
MPIVFITGAGTGVGKTYIGSLLVRQLRHARRDVIAFKPVASGMVPAEDPAFAETDTAQLLAAQGIAVDAESIAACTPWRFTRPLSPDMAAKAEGRPLQFTAIAEWADTVVRPAAHRALVVVEGVGGVMSPLAADALNIDLIAVLRCPAIVVSGTYLGAINHALTAIAALRARDIPIQALVLSETAGSTVDFAATLDTLSRFASGTRIAAVRLGAEAREGGAPTLAAALGLPLQAAPSSSYRTN